MELIARLVRDKTRVQMWITWHIHSMYAGKTADFSHFAVIVGYFSLLYVRQ